MSDGLDLLGTDSSEKRDDDTGMFTALLLIMVALPVGAALVLLPKWLSERRRASRWDVVKIEQPTWRQKRLRTTKADLLRDFSEGSVDSARRVTTARRLAAKETRVAGYVEALRLAEIRKWAKKTAAKVKRQEAGA